MILFILLFTCILFLGDSFTSLLKCKLNCWERFGLAYGLGLAIFTFGIFLSSFLGAPFSKYTLVVVFLILLGAIWGIKKKKRIGLDFKISWNKPTIAATILGIIILLVGLSSLFESVVRPIYTWDALAIWGTKGKAIFSLGNIQAVKDYGAQSYYPLNIPIAMAIFYNFGESFVKSIFPFYFVAMLAVFYGSLKRCGYGYVGLVGTLMLAVTPFVFFHSTIAYANLPMAFYYMASVIYLYQFFKNNNRAFLMLSSVLLGVGCWTRPDGLIWVFPSLAVLAVYALKRRRWLDPIFYLAPILIFVLPWSVFATYVIEVRSPYLTSALESVKQLFTLKINAAHLWEILRYFGGQIFIKETWLVVRGVLGWGYIWLFFFSVLILYCTRIRKYFYLLSIIGLDILVLFFIYYTSGLDGRLSWFLETGLNRITLHFFPLILYQTVLLISDDMGKWKTIQKPL